MAGLVDTSVLVHLERRGDPIAALAANVAGAPFMVSTISVAEMLFGVYRADSPRRRESRLAYIADVINELTVQPFDLESARIYARIWAQLQAAGNLIGVHDLQIGCTALAYDYSVITLNGRDFERVPGLTVVQPNW